HQFPPMKAETGWLKRADGSCLLEEERNKETTVVLVAVHGPCAVKSRLEMVDQATVQVIISPLSYPPGGESDVWAGKLQKLLQESIVAVEEHPRSLIQISIQPLCIGGNFLNCLV